MKLALGIIESLNKIYCSSGSESRLGLGDILKDVNNDPWRHVVLVVDNVRTTLPTPNNANIVVNGITLVNDNRVLFTNLSTKNNRVYQVSDLHKANKPCKWEIVKDGQEEDGSPVAGDALYVLTGSLGASIYVFNYSNAWVKIVAGSGTGDIRSDGSIAFTANQSMGNHKLTNLLDPTNAQDAATKKYVDDNSGSGGSIAPFVIALEGSDNTITMPNVDTSGQADGLKIRGIFNESGNGGDLILVAGKTNFGGSNGTVKVGEDANSLVTLFGSVTASNTLIVPAPTEPTHAATKQYVDDSAGAALGGWFISEDGNEFGRFDDLGQNDIIPPPTIIHGINKPNGQSGSGSGHTWKPRGGDLVLAGGVDQGGNFPAGYVWLNSDNVYQQNGKFATFTDGTRRTHDATPVPIMSRPLDDNSCTYFEFTVVARAADGSEYAKFKRGVTVSRKNNGLNKSAIIGGAETLGTDKNASGYDVGFAFSIYQAGSVLTDQLDLMVTGVNNTDAHLAIQDITYTNAAGDGGSGNLRSIRYVADASSGNESVTRSGDVFTMHIHASTTATQLVSKLNGAPAQLIVGGIFTYAITGTGSNLQVAASAANFIGGKTPDIDWQANAQRTIITPLE